ncbi:DUF4282 domain-containing protein [Nocardia sp. NPDC088792]|uniref:DUF4282 domain-containing protein n=1 Tax=Nocardia sp. NPDC088792 TaxID=3364332 RepID=UPI0038128863
MTFQPPPGPGVPGNPAFQPPLGSTGFDTSPKGFFASLFDFSFSSFVTPRVIKVLYVLVMIVAGFGALGLLILGFEVNPIVGILTLIIACPLYFFIVVALYRVAFEFFMAMFRMAEDIRVIRNRGGLR